MNVSILVHTVTGQLDVTPDMFLCICMYRAMSAETQVLSILIVNIIAHFGQVMVTPNLQVMLNQRANDLD